MESFVKKSIITTTILGIVLITTGAGLFYFSSAMIDRQKLVLDAKERLASYEQNKRAFAEESIKLKELVGQIDAYKKDAVSIGSVPQFLSSIESIAATYDIEFTITAAETVENENNSKELFVDISAVGDFENIISFSNEILQKRYQLQFVNFSLFREEQQKDIEGNFVTPTKPLEWSLLARIKIVTI